MAGRALLLRAEPGFSLPAYEKFAPPPPPALVAARLEAGSSPGDIVLEAGAPQDRFVLVEEGEIEVADPVTGERLHPSTLRAGQFMGELAFLNGGPLTLKALVDDQVQMVDIYSADPNIKANDLVTLDDPEGLFLASHVAPVVSDRVTDEMASVIDTVSAALTAEDLIELNSLSVDEQQSADQIAKDWLADQKLF